MKGVITGSFGSSDKFIVRMNQITHNKQPIPVSHLELNVTKVIKL